MKKLLALASAGAMLLSVSGAVFAFGFPGGTTTTNTAFVNQTVSSSAVSGGNTQASGGFFGGGSNYMITGSYVRSSATGVVVANTQVGCNTCSRSFGSATVKNTAFVNQGVESLGLSGDNTQANSGHGSNYMTTGSYVGSRALGVTVVNTSWTGSLN